MRDMTTAAAEALLVCWVVVVVVFVALCVRVRTKLIWLACSLHPLPRPCAGGPAPATVSYAVPLDGSPEAFEYVSNPAFTRGTAQDGTGTGDYEGLAQHGV